MTLEEACKLWIDRDFSAIPTPLIQKAYRDDPENLTQLAGNEPVSGYPCGWGWVFQPTDPTDEKWFKKHLDKVAGCGYLAFEADESGFFLAIDSPGKDFFKAHWLPLYKKRGLKWHKSKKVRAG